MKALVKSAIGSLMKEAVTLSTLEDETMYGMKVEIIGEVAKGWFRVRTHYRYEGFMNEDSLLFDDEKIKEWEQAKHGIVTHMYADILTLPKVQGAKLIALPRGAQVAVLEEADESSWIKVGLVDGQSGYMKAAFLGEYVPSIYQDDYVNFRIELPRKDRIIHFLDEKLGLTEVDFRQQVVKTALTYLGVQYRWGGKTSLGIDCSGLCSAAYMLNGLVIYRDASIKEGFPVHEIGFKDKKPGDLIFFPGHVAMYLGEDRFVHSTNKKGSDGVVINSLNPAHDDYREDLLRSITAVGSVF
jgi:hypothetical protein